MSNFSNSSAEKHARVAMRGDFFSFVVMCMKELGGENLIPNWHLRVIAYELMGVANGSNRRLIINLPPRHLKSILSSVAFPAWLLGQNPAARIICVSYAQDLSETFANDFRRIMTSRWYKETFPDTRLTSDRQPLRDLRTTKGGWRHATSINGVLTGRGAGYIIIDDPLKSGDAYSETVREGVNEWYRTSLISRLDNKATGAIVLVMQRLHEADLSGTLIATEEFRHLCLSAIAETDECHSIEILGFAKTRGRKAGEALHPERESLRTLNALRRTMGETVFAAQYQQRPLPAEGNLIKSRWLQYYRQDQLPKDFDTIFQSWDTANKLTDGSDFSVCTTWGVHEKKLYLLHVYRDRVDFPSLVRKVVTRRESAGASTVLIEDKASGTQLLQQLASQGWSYAKAITPDGDKISRMHGQTVHLENGVVSLPSEASWLTEFVRELLAFPNGRNDDQVDSTSQALSWFFAKQDTWGIIEFYEQENREYERWCE